VSLSVINGPSRAGMLVNYLHDSQLALRMLALYSDESSLSRRGIR
jgi:hypothetical protein